MGLLPLQSYLEESENKENVQHQMKPIKLSLLICKVLDQKYLGTHIVCQKDDPIYVCLYASWEGYKSEVGEKQNDSSYFCSCHGLTPASHDVPHSHSLSLPPAQVGRECEGKKLENLWDEINSV